MDGPQGYEPHSHYTPNAGYESGSSVVANPGPGHRPGHQQLHHTTAQLHPQVQQQHGHWPHVQQTHVQHPAGGASMGTPFSPIAPPIFGTPMHPSYFGDTHQWPQQLQQQPWQNWQQPMGAYSPAFNPAPSSRVRL